MDAILKSNKLIFSTLISLHLDMHALYIEGSSLFKDHVAGLDMPETLESEMDNGLN